MERAYHFASRPVEVEHRHPYLVFDHQDRLHFHLTVFAKEVSAQLSKGTSRTYLYAILPWFTFLDTDLWQQRTNHSWNASPLEIRQAVDSYLVQYLQCKVREQHDDLAPTSDSILESLQSATPACAHHAIVPSFHADGLDVPKEARKHRFVQPLLPVIIGIGRENHRATGEVPLVQQREQDGLLVAAVRFLLHFIQIIQAQKR
jgi:hypothetical protein